MEHVSAISISEIMPKLFAISIPAVIALLFSIVFIIIKNIQCRATGIRIGKKAYNSNLSVIFALNITGFMYAILEVLLIVSENVSWDKVNDTSLVYMVCIGLLCGVSGIAKGVISGNSLLKIANDTSDVTKKGNSLMRMKAVNVGTSGGSRSMSKLMCLCAVAELPALASLMMFVIKYFA